MQKYFNKIESVPLFVEAFESTTAYDDGTGGFDSEGVTGKMHYYYDFDAEGLEYHVILDEIFQGRFVVYFYFGDEEQEGIYTERADLGYKHIRCLMMTIANILKSAVKQFPIKELQFNGDADSKEAQSLANNRDENKMTKREKLYIGFVSKAFPECDVRRERAEMSKSTAYTFVIPVWEIQGSKYTEMVKSGDILDSQVEAKLKDYGELYSEGLADSAAYFSDEDSGIIINESIPYHMYSDFSKIEAGPSKLQFNVELTLDNDELKLIINPVPSNVEVFHNSLAMDELFDGVSVMIGQMLISLDGGNDMNLTKIIVSSSAFVDSVNVDTPFSERILMDLIDKKIFHGRITYDTSRRNGELIVSVNTVLNNLQI